MKRLITAVGKSAVNTLKTGARIAVISVRRKVTPATVLARAKRMITPTTRARLEETNARAMWSQIQKFHAEERYLERMLQLLKPEFGGEHEYALLTKEKTRAFHEALRLRRELTSLRQKQASQKSAKKG